MNASGGEPYASVIVPTHERAWILDLAIESIRRQTVANIEIVICGDGGPTTSGPWRTGSRTRTPGSSSTTSRKANGAAATTAIGPFAWQGATASSTATTTTC